MRTIFTALILITFISVNFAQSWVSQTSGVSSSLRQVYFINSNDGWTVGNGVYLKTTNGGTTWQKLSVGDGSLLIGCWMYKSTIGWVGGDNGVYFTSDAGSTWTHQVGPTNITRLWFFDSQNGWAVGGSTANHRGTMYKTTNGGTTWTTFIDASQISRLYGIQWYNQSIGWAFDDAGNFLRTTDGGNNWEWPNLGVTDLSINCMKFIDQNIGVLSGRSGTSGYILTTSDGGKTWNGASTPLTYLLVDVYFTSSTTGWAVGGNQTSSGFYKTTDAGKTWTLEQSSGAKPWSSIFFTDAANGWAVSESGDIMRYSGVSGINDPSGVPASFIVEQNFPNPFNPSTTIKFSLPYQSNVKIDVYNIAGQLISSVNNGIQESGSHDFNFNADKLSSGVYLYRVSAVSTDGKHNFQLSRKMTVLK